MTKETDGIITAIKASGIEHVVTDINLAGAHASNGNHYKTDCTPSTPAHPVDTQQGKVGRAVDFAHRRFDGKKDTPELLAIYKFFADAYGRNGQLNELYYAGPGADHCVRGGKFMLWTDVPRATRVAIADKHHNHVHVAVSKGVILTPPAAFVIEEDDMPKPDTKMDACLAPGGGVWVLTYDGGVRAEGGAPFFGSYPGLAPSRTKGERNFIAIEAVGDGYTIISDDDQASSYHFNAQVFEQIKKRAGRIS
jgi:hypothetical protein